MKSKTFYLSLCVFSTFLLIFSSTATMQVSDPVLGYSDELEGISTFSVLVEVFTRNGVAVDTYSQLPGSGIYDVIQGSSIHFILPSNLSEYDYYKTFLGSHRPQAPSYYDQTELSIDGEEQNTEILSPTFIVPTDLVLDNEEFNVFDKTSVLLSLIYSPTGLNSPDSNITTSSSVVNGVYSIDVEGELDEGNIDQFTLTAVYNMSNGIMQHFILSEITAQETVDLELTTIYSFLSPSNDDDDDSGDVDSDDDVSFLSIPLFSPLLAGTIIVSVFRVRSH